MPLGAPGPVDACEGAAGIPGPGGGGIPPGWCEEDPVPGGPERPAKWAC